MGLTLAVAVAEAEGFTEGAVWAVFATEGELATGVAVTPAEGMSPGSGATLAEPVTAGETAAPEGLAAAEEAVSAGGSPMRSEEGTTSGSVATGAPEPTGSAG